MPVGLTLIGAILAAVGFFASIYGAVILFTEGRRAKAKPRLGLASGVGPGTLSVWVDWDPSLFNLQIYRLRISHVSPENKAKEGTFTVTFENPQTEPFIQPIEMPGSFRDLLDRETQERSLFTFEFRTVDEMSIFLNCHLRKVKKVYQGLKTKMPRITHVLPVLSQDLATVFSLDFEELQARKKRMKDLEAAAKAKAAKAAAAKPAPAPAKPAAAPASPEAVPVADTKPASPAPAPAEEAKPSSSTKAEDKPVAAPAKVEDKPATAAAPKVEDKPATARSVRDVVSASNKNQAE
ncbi:MAG: hypothetical protein ACKOA8_15710 [Deltaproteobacteria bacterium]